jgi:hypothetical protein
VIIYVLNSLDKICITQLKKGGEKGYLGKLNDLLNGTKQMKRITHERENNNPERRISL